MSGNDVVKPDPTFLVLALDYLDILSDFLIEFEPR